MLYSRDPRLALFADKLRARDYIKDSVGVRYMIPLLWSGTEPDLIPYDRLPQAFVIKATHGCGYNVVVPNKRVMNRERTSAQLKDWLRHNYCTDNFLGVEWCYRNIRASIVVEAMLESNGKPPIDYKFFCFSGRAEFVQLDFDRFEHHSRALFDRNLAPLELQLNYPRDTRKIAFPDNIQEMLRVAEILARDLDFLRVDLYAVAGRTYVGELTSYPGAGSEKFTPTHYDFLFGTKWKPRTPA